MTETPTSIISHMSLGTNDFARAAAFYDTTLAALNIARVMEHEDAVAYGRKFPEFWVQTPFDGKSANVGNGTHVAFIAVNKSEVHAFYDAALSAGATCDGPPGPREPYGPPYYGCFVRDLDGHKIEAAFWDEALAKELGIA